MKSPADGFENYFKPGTKIQKVFAVLKDLEWHCRECEYLHTGVTQIAGGSGIQGLEGGTRSRPGLTIESDNQFCLTCSRSTRHDRWTGEIVPSVHAGSMPDRFIKRALTVFDSRDVVENSKRKLSQVTIDHKLPRIRWTPEVGERLTDYSNMTESDIKAHFQLLKKSNGSVSHNMLKSRACETCLKTGQRGEPFGISFFYEGGPMWEPADEKDPAGCVGCGWYDFDAWRTALNKMLSVLQS